MFGHFCVLSAPKLGSSANEYEDAAAAFPQSGELLPGTSFLRIAVSDGATESMLAAQWARLLVNSSAHNSSESLAGCVEIAIDMWPGVHDDYIAERNDRLMPIRWYEEPGLERGAFATLLIANFSSDGQKGGTWKAEAVGDSNLFHVRDDTLLAAFPCTSSKDFNTSPALIQSKNINMEILREHSHHSLGGWESGDSFYLTTDALAAWFLARVESGGRPWETWRDLDEETFSIWSETERTDRLLKNDDLTLARLDLY